MSATSRSLLWGIWLAILFLVPAAGAHDPPGLPDTSCTGPSMVHDYAGVAPPPPAPIVVDDFNLEECGYKPAYKWFPPCDGIYSPPCDSDMPADPDGEAEFGFGGGILDGGHHSNTVCVADEAGSAIFSVNGFLGTGGCLTVPVAPQYEVRILQGRLGHIWT